MAKERNWLWRRRREAAMSAGLLLSALLQAIGQQTSPNVTSNLDESGSLSSRRSASPTQSGVIAVPEGFERLRLASGDLLQMDVYDTPEMSTLLRIDDQGDVAVPLIGSVHIGGATLPEAQRAIATMLVDKKILKSPQVTLNLLQYTAKSVSVVGEVQVPGRIQLLVPTPLGDVLALAGGETIAAGNDIEIEHRSEDGEIATQHVSYAAGDDASALRSVMVNPGDTVHINRAGVIYVLGAVNRPGGYLMVNGGKLSVVQAVALAQGTTLQASTRFAVVVRPQKVGFVEFEVPLGKMQMGEASPVQLELNDVLFIPTSTWKAVLINGSNVLSAATSAAIYNIH